MKFTNPFRKYLNRPEKVAALTASLAAAEKIADPGERLLELKKISAQTHDAYYAIDNKAANITLGAGGLPAAVLVMGGLLATAVTGAALPVVAAVAGFGTLVLMFVMREGLGVDSLKALREIETRADAAQDKILQTVSMTDIAKSNSFDAVMEAYPALKEKFTLQASRAKVLSAEQPEAPQPAPRGKNSFNP